MLCPYPKNHKPQPTKAPTPSPQFTHHLKTTPNPRRNTKPSPQQSAILKSTGGKPHDHQRTTTALCVQMRHTTNQSFSSLNFPLDQLPGLSAKDYQKLQDYGITTTYGLLQKAGRTKAQKEALAIALNVRFQLLMKWVALADLARIPAVGCQYCGLIVHSGIASLEQLAQTPIDRLHRQIMRLQIQNLQRADLCPDLGEMSVWIKQARQLAMHR